MIFIGTSIICVLEAVYQSRLGKSILMLDRQSSIGGAWRSLELFGLNDVENAIHYFLPDQLAPNFMKNVLKWNITTDLKKYRVFPLFPVGCLRIPYDNRFGRFISEIIEGIKQKSGQSLSGTVLEALRDLLFKSRPPSYYVEGGTLEMLKKVNLILENSSVKVRYSTSIDRIHIDLSEKIVKVSIEKECIFANTIYFSHGSRISNLTGPSGLYQIVEKEHLRPAVHMLIQDSSPTTMYECIFTADPLIKYVHDITRNLRESSMLIGKKKLLVFALQKDIRESNMVYQLVFEKLKRVGMIGKSAVLENQYWQDIYLPRLEDSDLKRLKDAFGDQVEYLKTEDFAKGLGLYAEKWTAKIQFPE